MFIKEINIVKYRIVTYWEAELCFFILFFYWNFVQYNICLKGKYDLIEGLLHEAFIVF